MVCVSFLAFLHVALAGGDRADLVSVAALRGACKVRDDAFAPRLRRLGTKPMDERSNQRLVVHARRAADEHAIAPALVGQVGVARDRPGGHAVLRGHDQSHPPREREPPALGVAQVFRHTLLELFGLDRCQHAGLQRSFEAGRVDGDEHVGRAQIALSLDAGEELVAPALDEVDLDAGFGGEPLVQGVVGVVVACRVDVDDFLRRRVFGRVAGADREDDCKHQGQQCGHERLLLRFRGRGRSRPRQGRPY
eukprot:TRINITY_DN30598_c0_g1_i2.p3 TRINITY_DN30598_c0_g1~~TRINITY_DN30598_c0_g1_i2.p3  ORF type:complete len:275 (+),score=28.93 TRINITY_DN30598_c0_g1_i2:77-826(+)